MIPLSNSLCAGLPAIGLFAVLFAPCCATATPPRRFATPDLAVDSLVSALRATDADRAREILGSGADTIFSSGDPAADRARIETFLARFDEQHHLVEDPAGGRKLLVGPSDWSMPIPIVEEDRQWYFDTQAGLDEILTRRIGRNELSAMQVCLAVVDAQREYAGMDPGGDGLPQYAQRFASEPAHRNGLYWPAAEGEPASPLGPLAAAACEEGDTDHSGACTCKPYHGYLYRMLRSQGPNAPGGACDFVVNGKMIAGFGLVAWPAEYGNSGIATFIVSDDGILFERDLGTDTPRIARSMTCFDPGPGWKRVE